jgi:glycosyltransferase involved in cell wall biosynthesis
MHVLHTIPRFPRVDRDTVIGGAASALWAVARAQAKAGDQIGILSSLPSGPPTDDGSGVRLYHLAVGQRPSSVRFGASYSLRVIRASRQIDRIDVLHGHSGFADYVLSTLLLSSRHRRPTVHTLYCPLPASGVRRLTGAFLTRCAYRRGVRLVAISQHVARSLAAVGVPAHAVRVVPPAVDVERYSGRDRREHVRAQLCVPRDAPVMLFVGNWKQAKNLERVLATLKLLVPQYPDLVLIATTELRSTKDEPRRQMLSQLVENWSLARHIRWVGVTNDMPGLMAAADVLVAPFLHTYGPSDYFVAALEAMVAGLPVVVSAVGGMPEVVDASRGRLVDPTDARDIAHAISTLLGNEDLCHAVAERAQAYARATFSPTAICRTMQAAYDEVFNVRCNR